MRIRTGYSFRTAVGHLKEVAAAIPYPYQPISDRGSTFGFNRWNKLNKRPIFGVELAVTHALKEKKPTFDYWTFFAIDSLRPLHELIGLATAHAGKEAHITYREALAAKGLIKISGERLLIDKLDGDTDNFFVGLSPSLPKGLFNLAKEAKLKFIATSDNYYPTAADLEFYRVTLGTKFSHTQSYPQHILTDEEWREATQWIASKKEQDAAIKNRERAAAMCVAKIHRANLLVPDKPKTLRAMCEEGAVELGINLADQVYKARLDRELALIEQKQFEDYFYIISDIIQFAKKKMIVGPARGSSCGSLVCYLLKITSIDPIPYNLIFERFIDTTRSDLPDIDIDFSDQLRDKVFQYVEEKYGKERVARLGTVGLFKPRSAINQAGIALRIPKWDVEKLSDSIVVRSSGDARALQAMEDTFNDTEVGRAFKEKYPEAMIATRMEGHPNNASQHAAGVVITEEPIINYVAIDSRTKSVMCDKKDAEAYNLQKIDCLGLTQLSIFERTLELIGVPPISGWLEQLPLNDQSAFDVINKGNFSGIFQFNGGALQSLAKQIKTSSLDDIIAMTALARPGPLVSGGANTWVRRKNGVEPITYPHPLFEPYMENTQGVVIYQEQVMQIGRAIGDLSWEDVSAIRKSMSASLGKEHFNKWGDSWKKGGRAKGIPIEVLDKVWDDLCAYGSWSFNKSHAVAYGLVSYWCCWLKSHHPFEFAAATLDAETDPTRQIALLREMKEEGIEYIPIDADRSIDRWLPITREDGSRVLVGPLQNVKGIGPKKVIEIKEAREANLQLKPGLQSTLANAKTDIDSLYPVADRIKKLLPDPAARNIVSDPVPIKEVQPGKRGSVLIFGVARRIVPRDVNETINVAKRNGRVLTGKTAYLNLFVRDDTDEIYCKVDTWKFDELGRGVVERGRAGSALYAIKGTVPDDFRMIKIQNIKYLGDMDGD